MALIEYAKKNIVVVQKEIETELDLRLGDISVLSFEDLVEDILKISPELTPNEKKHKQKAYIAELSGVSGGFHPRFPESLYFNKITSYENNGLDDEVVEALYFRNLAHELGHLSHFRIIGEEKYKQLGSDISEGFACYLSEKLTNKKSDVVLPPEKRSYVYAREYLKQELKSQKIETPDKLKEFLRNNLTFR